MNKQTELRAKYESLLLELESHFAIPDVMAVEVHNKTLDTILEWHNKELLAAVNRLLRSSNSTVYKNGQPYCVIPQSVIDLEMEKIK